MNALHRVLLPALLLLAGCTTRSDAPPPPSASPASSEPGAASSAPAAPAKVWFEGSFEEGLAQARAEKKLVFVDVFTTWCPPCKKLKKVTFEDAAVKADLAKMVSMAIDAESPAGQPVAARYRVGSYPTLLVLDGSGQEIGRIVGFLEPARFLTQLGTIRARVAK